MTFPLDQFVRNLVESQLMTAAEAAAFQQQLPPEHPPQNGEDLAREMVRQNVLTTFQAAALYQGRLKELVFGPYVVLDKLGAGKMGFVYKARHKELGLIFAVKVLPARRVAQSPKALARFQREVALHVRLIHPNIVRVHDAGEAHGLPYLVMEYVDGQDLDLLVKETGPLPPAEAVECIVQTAAGMAYAHREGIVHRDIKPANLLLDKNGVVKILDLGLGRFNEQVLGDDEDASGRLTGDMQILGTPNYMAPEQARNPREADARCDVYSLGCTLYYLLTGRPPFAADTPIRTLLAHRESPIPSLCAQRADVPPEVESAFFKMLAKDPAQRHQSMDDVVAAFKPPAAPAPSPLQAVSPVQEPRIQAAPIEDAELITPLPKRGRSLSSSAIAAGVIIALVLLALILVWLMPPWW